MIMFIHESFPPLTRATTFIVNRLSCSRWQSEAGSAGLRRLLKVCLRC